MKKALLFTLLTSLALFSQAQISFTYNGQPLNDGDTVYLQTSDGEVEFQPTMVNSGSTDRVCYMRGTWVIEPSDVVVSMCAGIHCSTGLKSAPFTLAANSEYSEGHVDFYFPSGNTTCLLKYFVYDTIETAVRATCFLYIDKPAAIEGIADNSSLRAFPNPASSMVTISYTLSEPTGAVVVYNMSGAKVMEVPVNGADESVRIDVSALVSGLYMYGVRDGGRMSSMHKLVVK